MTKAIQDANVLLFFKIMVLDKWFIIGAVLNQNQPYDDRISKSIGIN